jgi:hypothetical protein
MKFRFYVFLTFIGFGLTSCYGMMGSGLNSAYVQPNSDQDQQTDQVYQPRDTVYLKDGSIIHGYIVSEQPGVSLQIKIKSGNLFTYQMTDVAKITHNRQSADDSTADANNRDNSSERQQ